MTKRQTEADRQRESAAILTRIRQETEPQTGAGVERIVTGARRHFAAGDVDPSDRIDVVGTRIGRLAGFGFFLFLVGSLVVTYLMP